MNFLKRRLEYLTTYKNDRFTSEEDIKLNQATNRYLMVATFWFGFFALLLIALNIYLVYIDSEKYAHIFMTFSPVITPLFFINPIIFVIRFRFKDPFKPVIAHNVMAIALLCAFAILTGKEIITYLLPTCLLPLPFFYLPRSYKRLLSFTTAINLSLIAISLFIIFNIDLSVTVPLFVKPWATPAIVFAIAIIYIQIGYVASEASHHHTDLMTAAHEDLGQAYDKIKARDQRLQHELDFAADIQKSVIPLTFPDDGLLSLAIDSIPYGKVTGDYVDMVTNENGQYILVADASGHGIPAALVTVVAKQVFHDALLKHQKPGEILAEINEKLADAVTTSDYLTAFLLLVEPDGTMYFTQAGHPNPVYIRAHDHRFFSLATDGMVVGLVKELPMDYETKSIQLEKGDRIVLFSDGITEQKNAASVELGMETFHGWMKEIQKSDYKEFHKELMKAWYGYVGGASYTDDITLVTLEYEPPKLTP